MAKNSLALGLCFFRGEMAKARMVSSQAISLGSRENLHNITIRILHRGTSLSFQRSMDHLPYGTVYIRIHRFLSDGIY